ncbi:MAG: hypothetical protein KKG33_05925 [candidate division Zixibacteria bacterium]|nr:hypothetical protein [candidate division Zixibacteria bacterium]MBU1471043.1 hypothetical protein [candidate division Zixibacteria bacterium]MBU2625079.1 hypothetical protein [candidate division Zixibacteria bacterium]
MAINELPVSVIERMGFYVYTLSDPKTGEVFYVGKGTGNRLFAHINEAIEKSIESDKLDRIQQIHASGRSVKYEIIRHGLSEEGAYEVESALIDFIGLSRLTNIDAGHGTDNRGKMTIPEIIATYRAEPIVIKEPALLIIVNRLFERNISVAQLYEITRGNWVVGKNRNNAQYAFSVFKGVVHEVYRIKRWLPAPARNPDQKRTARWRFSGEVAKELQHYIGGSVENYLKHGAQNPIRYVNC